MAGRLRGWRALTWRERAQFTALVPALALVHAALALFGYVRTRRALERLSERAPRREPTDHDLAQARRLSELAAIAGRHGLVTATCLRQSLVVYAWLRRRGLDPELKIGVDRVGTVPDMHAWVALAGEALAPSGVRHAVFSASTASRQADTDATTSGKRA